MKTASGNPTWKKESKAKPLPRQEQRAKKITTPVTGWSPTAWKREK